MKRFCILLCCLLSLSATVFSQTDSGKSTQQKKADKKKEQQIKSAKKAEEEGIKKHEELQTKEVRKRMRRNRHRYNHVDSFDRRPNFFQRLFPHKRASAN